MSRGATGLGVLEGQNDGFWACSEQTCGAALGALAVGERKPEPNGSTAGRQESHQALVTPLKEVAPGVGTAHLHMHPPNTDPHSRGDL